MCADHESQKIGWKDFHLFIVLLGSKIKLWLRCLRFSICASTQLTMQLFGREKYTRNDRIEDHFCPRWGVSEKERLDYVKGDEKSGMREMEMFV